MQGFIAVGALVVLALIVVGRSIRVVGQGTAGVVTRLGRFHAVREPGIVALVPILDRMRMVDMRELGRPERIEAGTRDRVSVVVDATVWHQVVDARLATFRVSDYVVAIDQLFRTSLRTVLEETTFDDVVDRRDQINARAKNRMDVLAEGLGVRINRLEIQDVRRDDGRRMLALVARFDLRPGREADFDRLVEATTARIRADEPGTLLYLCHTVQGEPGARIFYELYRDRAAFDAHERQPHVKYFLAQREWYAVGPARVELMDRLDGKGWPGA